jgi:protein-disulfide isomerase
MKKFVFLIGTLLLGGFVTMSAFAAPDLGEHVVQLKPDQANVFLSKSDNCIGNPDAKTVIVDFFDYNCPDCRTISKFLTEQVKKNSDVKVVFVDYPKLGSSSTFDAKAAIAAKQQGKYSEVHDILINSPRKITEEQVFNLCKTAGVVVDKLKKDISSNAVSSELLNNLLLGTQLNIKYVPTIIIAKLNATADKSGKVKQNAPAEAKLILMNTAKETREAILKEINSQNTPEVVPTKTVKLSPELQKMFMENGQNVIGNKSGNTVVVDFYDYYCSDCRYIAKYFEQILPLENNLKIVFIDDPILGDQSMFAAKAALAAKSQNKYLDVHKALISAKGKLKNEEVYNICQKLGLDIDQLKKDINSTAISSEILDNMLITKNFLKIKFVPVILIAKLQTKVDDNGVKTLMPPEEATMIMTDAHAKVKQSIQSQLDTLKLTGVCT